LRKKNSLFRISWKVCSFHLKISINFDSKKSILLLFFVDEAVGELAITLGDAPTPRVEVVTFLIPGLVVDLRLKLFDCPCLVKAKREKLIFEERIFLFTGVSFGRCGDGNCDFFIGLLLSFFFNNFSGPGER